MKSPRRTTLCFMLIVIYFSQATLNLNLESIVHPLVSTPMSAIFFLVRFFWFPGNVRDGNCFRNFFKAFEKMLQMWGWSGEHKWMSVCLLCYNLPHSGISGGRGNILQPLSLTKWPPLNLKPHSETENNDYKADFEGGSGDMFSKNAFKLEHHTRTHFTRY